MATKRKVKRFAEGGSDVDSGEWARGEDYGDGTTGDERVAMARKTADLFSPEIAKAAGSKGLSENEGLGKTTGGFKGATSEIESPKEPAIVTKEQLAKSGFTNLRDYLNDQQHLKRRGESSAAATEVKKEIANKLKDDQYNPDVKQRAAAPRVGRAGQATVDFSPRNQSTAEGLKSMREQDEQQRNEFMNNRLMRGLRSVFSTPKTRGGSTYAKGGAVKQTASSRADGIAQRGKTRGTIVACGGGSMKGKK